MCKNLDSWTWWVKNFFYVIFKVILFVPHLFFRLKASTIYFLFYVLKKLPFKISSFPLCKFCFSLIRTELKRRQNSIFLKENVENIMFSDCKCESKSLFIFFPFLLLQFIKICVLFIAKTEVLLMHGRVHG